ncbi:hypothetical protein CCP4SC76_2990001 [Gammaproteobacteria bacterium]
MNRAKWLIVQLCANIDNMVGSHDNPCSDNLMSRILLKTKCTGKIHEYVIKISMLKTNSGFIYIIRANS